MGLSAVMPTFHLDSFAIISISYAIEHCYGNHLVLLLLFAMYKSALLILQLLQLKMTGFSTPSPAPPTHSVPSYAMHSRCLSRYYTTTQAKHTTLPIRIILGKHIDKLHCVIIMAHTH